MFIWLPFGLRGINSVQRAENPPIAKKNKKVGLLLGVFYYYFFLKLKPPCQCRFVGTMGVGAAIACFFCGVTVTVVRIVVKLGSTMSNSAENTEIVRKMRTQ